MEKYIINIANNFSEMLGGRWKKVGPFSGELFYETILRAKYLNATRDNEKLHIYLDGTKGYGSSFLDQSFGELAREFGVEVVRNTIVFHTESFSWNVEYINNEIWSKK
jgi:hypothetical protein